MSSKGSEVTAINRKTERTSRTHSSKQRKIVFYEPIYADVSHSMSHASIQTVDRKTSTCSPYCINIKLQLILAKRNQGLFQFRLTGLNVFGASI